jgi:hypothetical protein
MKKVRANKKRSTQRPDYLSAQEKHRLFLGALLVRVLSMKLLPTSVDVFAHKVPAQLMLHQRGPIMERKCPEGLRWRIRRHDET